MNPDEGTIASWNAKWRTGTRWDGAPPSVKKTAKGIILK